MKTVICVVIMLFFSHPTLLASEPYQLEEGQPFYFSIWDPEAGRKAFTEMKCFACHEVKWDDGLPKPFASIRGPRLGARADLTAHNMMDAIVSPSHVISPEFAPKIEVGEASPMPDFSETMTVRQMIDIIAYLTSFDE